MQPACRFGPKAVNTIAETTNSQNRLGRLILGYLSNGQGYRKLGLLCNSNGQVHCLQGIPMKKFLALLLLCQLLVLNASCSPAQSTTTQSSQNSSQESAVKAMTLGSVSNLTRAGAIYCSGQFKASDLEQIQKLGVKRIISLRAISELNWDEADAVRKAGISFVQIPISSPDALTDETLNSIRELLRDEKETTLLHCAGAVRVAAVWLPFRVLDQGIALETAMLEAKQIGLKAKPYEAKALDFIARMQAQEKEQMATVTKSEGMRKSEITESVKPGINDSFLSADLNVDDFVKRFEIESREIFVARERILAACKVKKGNRIADVGAGTGLFTRSFSVEVGRGGWVYAVDIAPRFLEHINQDASTNGLTNITCVLCSDNNSCLPGDSVDLVFVCDTYHHFEYPDATLKSIYNALHQGGRLVVVDFERIPGSSREWTLDHVRAGKEVVQQEIERAGFNFVEEIEIPGLEENYFLEFQKD